MKNTLAASACALALLTASANAGTYSKPTMSESVVIEDTNHNSEETQIILGWIMLLSIMGLGIAGL